MQHAGDATELPRRPCSVLTTVDDGKPEQRQWQHRWRGPTGLATRHTPSAAAATADANEFIFRRSKPSKH